MTTLTGSDLERLDAGLARLRRLWESQQIKRHFLEMLGTPVEASLVRTLRAVERSTSQEPSICDVADALQVDGSTASRFVDQAAAAGYIARATSTSDRRRSVLTLTEGGSDLLAQATRVRADLLAELTAGWDEADVATLADLLDRLATAVVAMESRS